MGMQVSPSLSQLQGPVQVNGNEVVTGQVSGAAVATNNVAAVMGTENGGGNLVLSQANAADANPGANAVKVYVRPGSVSGLSLRVRAGAAGAETILLDNIPV